MQRSRLLTAAVGAFADLGYADASVARICARAGISRRTFYELFDNRDECLAAILVDVETRLERELLAAGLATAPWRERVRGGLWLILCTLECEPALGRVCLRESSRGGPLVLGERERIIKRLIAVVDEGRVESGPAKTLGVVTAEGVVGALLAVMTSGDRLPPHAQAETQGTAVASRLANASPQALSCQSRRTQGKAVAGRLANAGLLGELMALVVLPYLGAVAAQRELQRQSPRLPEDSFAVVDGMQMALDGEDPLAGMPARLTYRTARVLQAAGESSHASNREIAERAGVRDPGQISKLLSRLEQRGLLSKNVVARGEPNQWALTSAGARLLRALGAHMQQVARAPHHGRARQTNPQGTGRGNTR